MKRRPGNNSEPSRELIRYNGGLYRRVDEPSDNLPVLRRQSYPAVRERRPAVREQYRGPYARKQKQRRNLGQRAVSGSWNTLKGTGKFIWEAKNNSFKGHLHKAALAGVALTAVWLGNDNAPDKDACGSVQQERVVTGSIEGPLPIDKGAPLKVKNFIRSTADTLTFGWKPLNDNRSIGDIAQDMTDRWGYYVPEERLAALNAKYFEKDDDGKIKGHLPVSMTEGKMYCLRVPGPIYYGFEDVDTPDRSLYNIADDTKVDMNSLRAWNPELGKYDADEELPIGTLVQTQASVNNKFVLRPMTEEDKERSKKEKETVMAINASLMGVGDAPDEPGEVGYFPLEGSYFVDGKMKYTADIVRAAFTIEGTPINVQGSQLDPGDKKLPPVTKKPPKKPKDPTTPKDPEKKPPKQEIKINTDDLTPSQASIARIIVNTAYGLDIPDDRKYKAAEIGLITAMVESDMKNLKGGDRDSVGVFQQRAGWGSYSQRHNVQWATNAFYHGGSNGYSEPGLLDKKNWWKKPSGDVAQDVQRSGYPDRYGMRIDEARKILGNR